MKKIIAFLLIGIFLSSGISFACQTDVDCKLGLETCQNINYVLNPPSGTCVSIIPGQQINNNTTCDPICKSDEECIFESPTEKRVCFKKNNNQTPAESVMGITCTEDMLVQGQCKLSIYDTLGIRKSIRGKDEATSVGLFVQDIILSATFFIGTVVTIALIISGLMYIFAAASGKDPANAKKGIIGSLIGLLLVVSSYVIIRLIQYLAKGF